jgi:hypothetical protein
MPPPPTEVERAYQLARSGQYTTLKQLIEALRAEGYDGVQLSLPAYGLRSELLTLMNPSRKGRRTAQRLRKRVKVAPS